MRLVYQIAISTIIMIGSAFMLQAQNNVGIGTETPSQKLHVDGKILLSDDTQTPEAGTIRFNPETNDFEGFNGGAWLSLTRARSFSRPKNLNDNLSPVFDGADEPIVAISDNGDAVIVWLQQTPGIINQLFMSERRNGEWINPPSISDFINPSAIINEVEDHGCAIDGNGNALICWTQQDNGGTDHIYVSQYENGSWTHPSDINDFFSLAGSVATNPAVAMDKHGDAIVAWRQHDGAFMRMYKSEYRNGTWTHPATINDNFSPNGSNALDAPAVAMSENGDAVIAWRQWDGLYWRIFYSEYRNGSWSHPSFINQSISPNGSSAQPPVVAIDKSGNTIIAWTQSNGTEGQIYMSHYFNGSWTHPFTLGSHISPAGQAASKVAIAAGDGRAMLAWRQTNGIGDDLLFVSEFVDSTWTHPANFFDHVGFAGNDVFELDVAMNVRNEAVLSWVQWNGSLWAIHKATLCNGIWDYPVSVNDHLNIQVSGFKPNIGVNAFFGVLIAWQQASSAHNEIFISEY